MENTELIVKLNKLKLESTNYQETADIPIYHYTLFSDETVHANLHTIAQLPFEDRPFIHIHYAFKDLGIAGIWRPDAGFEKNLTGDWSNAKQINISHSGPIVCFFDSGSNNVLTFALSELNRDISLLAGVHEETGEIYLDALIYLCESVNRYSLSVRIDRQQFSFCKAIQSVSSWWDSLLPERPLPSPEDARLPMYSTWYSYHQEVAEKSLLKEGVIASSLGMKTILLDDGWQTADNNRGYGYCGDWNAEKSKFPDFRGYIDELHSLGIRCIVWYSVPFVGKYSGIWSDFQNMLLHYDDVLNAGILDPRYPQVRSYLISVYEKSATDWDLDGFKLDFIDSFRNYPDTPPQNDKMDYAEIQEAVYHLMLDISHHLHRIRKDLMIEFRQNYIGPQMRRFGNIFRVGDCPLSPVTNRVGITDLRLLSGNSAVHSDMLMWHPEETPENVAVQLINCIFATLQISVRLADLLPAQQQVLQHYLDFSIQYKDTLQSGEFTAYSPLSSYPVIQSQDEKICITAYYDRNLVLPLSEKETCIFLNGSSGSSLYLSCSRETKVQLRTWQCTGTLLEHSCITITPGIHSFPVPVGGMTTITKAL
ncbi:MAG: alpha-galactosidase [Lachnospiraceae bacterium]|nr:alpha-galactosidase [Lachnospiraceae bacterium]